MATQIQGTTNSRFSNLIPGLQGPVRGIFYVSQQHGQSSNDGLTPANPKSDLQDTVQACHDDRVLNGGGLQYIINVLDGDFPRLVLGVDVVQDIAWTTSISVKLIASEFPFDDGSNTILSFNRPPVILRELIIGDFNTAYFAGFLLFNDVDATTLFQLPAGFATFFKCELTNQTTDTPVVEAQADVLVGTVTLSATFTFTSVEFIGCQVRGFFIPLIVQAAEITGFGCEWEFTDCRVFSTTTSAANNDKSVFSLDSGASGFNYGGIRASNTVFSPTALSSQTKGILSYTGGSFYFFEFQNACNLNGATVSDTFYMFGIDVGQDDIAAGGLLDISDADVNFGGSSHPNIWANHDTSSATENMGVLFKGNRSDNRATFDLPDNDRIPGDFAVSPADAARMVGRFERSWVPVEWLDDTGVAVDAGAPIVLATTAFLNFLTMGGTADTFLRDIKIWVGVSAADALVTTIGAVVKWVDVLGSGADVEAKWNITATGCQIINNDGASRVLKVLFFGFKPFQTTADIFA